MDRVSKTGEVENLTVVHGEAPDYEELLDLLDKVYPRDDIEVPIMGSTIGTHAGPGVIGVTFQVPKSS